MEKEKHEIKNTRVPALSQSSVKANTLIQCHNYLFKNNEKHHACISATRALELRVYIKYQLIIMHTRTLPRSLQTAAVPCTPPLWGPFGSFSTAMSLQMVYR